MTSEGRSTAARSPQGRWPFRRRHVAGRVVCLLVAPALLFACTRTAERPPSHTVYDLVEEASFAEVRRPTSIIDFGEPSARAFMVRNWSALSRDLPGGGTGTWSLGDSAEIEIFVARPHDLSVTLRCASVTPQDEAQEPILSVWVNGASLTTLKLQPSLTDMEFQIPSDLLQRGENRLRFLHPAANQPRILRNDVRVLWDYLRIDAEAPAPSSEPRVDVPNAALLVPLGTRVDYYLDVPPRSFLSAGTLRFRGSASGSLHITWRPLGGKTVSLGEILSSSKELRLEMTSSERERGVLSLFVLGQEGPHADEGMAILSRPEIRSVEEESASLQGTRPASRGDAAEPLAKPNVLIYMIDALRADHLGCYGYPRETSPHIDSFARDGVLFRNAQAQSSWTRSSVASLFTGLWPQSHGANDDNDALHEEIHTLAEYLNEEGYSTVGLVANGNVSKHFGFSQGFDQYRFIAYGERGEILASSEDINKLVFEWLDAYKEDKPFFLYIHTVDPHAPYDPPEAFRRRFAPQVQNTRIGAIENIVELEKQSDPMIQDLVGDLLDLYDGEIAANDASFGALVSELKRRGLYDDSLIVLLSDHGEEFYDHGDWTHGKTLYSEVLEIPLIVKEPRSRSARVVDHLVDHVDLLPTILEIVGVPAPAEIQGRSLVPLMDSRSDSPWKDLTISHLDLRRRLVTSVATDRWKIIQLQTADGGGFPALYNRREDPSEAVNLAPEMADLARYLVAVKRREEAKISGRYSEEAIDDPDKKELLEGLRALGYIH